MNTAQKVAYWVDIARYDLETARQMQRTKRYLYTVFMCQQSIEKLLKAIYLLKFKKEAPRSHNLVYLESLASLAIDDQQQNLLAELTAYYIEGRYPNYKVKLSALLSRRKAGVILGRTEVLFRWLKKKTG